MARLAGMPILVRVGTFFFTLGAVADLIYHLLPSTLNPFASFAGPDGLYTHIAAYTGLLLVVAGIFEMGLSADE
jgi:hypothetical protein